MIRIKSKSGEYFNLEPEFLRLVSSFRFKNFVNHEGQYEVQGEFTVEYKKSKELVLRFINISRILFPEFGSSRAFAFSDLMIENIENMGMEKIKYSAIDHVTGFLCESEDLLIISE